jgi:heavy metal efflux system protein
MLDKIIYYSIQNKLVIGILTIGLIIWGCYSMTRLPIDAVPDITNNQVQILTTAPSQSALDIERLVTFPVEQTMSTIPGIDEIRSFSRFGLSVVTIVFHDNIDIYWARQQVNERLAVASRQIPTGIGSPELSPVTTGLGEIYQYIIRPEKGYESKYDAMELRSIQDWIVRRQLLGTPGVAEVASFGGYLKQYEISIDPDKLRSYNLGVGDVFEALEKNNQNTGGAYIDKKPNAYFIRSVGLIGSLDDIGSIVVSNTQHGVPILIRNIADVQFGHATRYGAMTYNAEGEVVGAIVLMLKGENSSAVVDHVKERMEQIKATLPEGVMIDTFLDRSDLVSRAIGTVERNLIEGALIVIIVLVLFLGNLRAGLIVASVIPLSMLFAVSLMHVFGVSGNLMSLGAIDFGLIVDGAVIIVEATMHYLGMRTITQRLTQAEMDLRVYESASKIRSSAAFGEIIILIVYLPILALVGIEGKMFKPMAQTVSFAIVGAFILSLTYVPMMSALFLSKTIEHKRNFSDKMMDFFHRYYRPVINAALHRKALAVGTSIVLLFISVVLFFQMGGEFLPTLEEGDFAVETRVLTGSSLSYTVETSTKAADVLLREFPDEVEEVVSKVGSAEIPTDPMSIESCDLMVILKPKNKWMKADDREALAEKMSEALEVVPGVTFGFQQPIQMRFNELISGVKQDVAIKIFGEDLGVLTDLSQQIGHLVRSVDGARDVYVEEMDGLPQIVVDINRDEIAKYGMSVADINRAINISFAGQSAGLVFEGERRYDLAVRLMSDNRQGIEDVRNLYVTSPAGQQIPLKQLARVEFKIGPNQIQREDAKRRIIVAFNVRGRDVSTIVKEIQVKINDRVQFPAGYYATYGGQFENLEEAQARLQVAVPAALLLILVLLFFTFYSMKQALLIFSAIPMAAIGGIFALLFRGMPFSISAGVGFIALFGVAVLNGIVLIAEFNRLKNEGLTDLNEIVMKGTEIRLRPVLMTAAVASLGFLPMALATSAGAEVQKPLATVVIGGLVSSTILTLVVLPCLYIYFDRFKFNRRSTTLIAFLLLGIGSTAHAQQAPSALSLQEAVDQALRNNPKIAAAAFDVQSHEQLRKTSFDLPKTELILTRGQYNGYAKNDNNFTISQSIPATAFGSQGRLNRSLVTASSLKKAATENELALQVKQTYYQLALAYSVRTLRQQEDSIYEGFYKAASLRYKTGETNILELTTAEVQRNDAKNALTENESAILSLRAHLKSLLCTNFLPDIGEKELAERTVSVTLDSSLISGNPRLAYTRQQVDVASRERKLQGAKASPDLLLGYFNQTLIGAVNPETGESATKGSRFTGFQIGLAIPLWFVPHQGRINAAARKVDASASMYASENAALSAEHEQAVQSFQRYKNSLAYYRASAMPNADLISKQSQIGFKSGDIGYAEYLLGMKNAISIHERYLQTLHDYNQSVVYIEYLAGIK